MTVQSKLIEIIRLQQDDIDELRKENQYLRERIEEMVYTFVPRTEQEPKQPSMPEPLHPYTIPNQPHYEPVTIGSNCAACGIKLEGVMSYTCARPQCPTGLGSPWCSTGPSNYVD